MKREHFVTVNTINDLCQFYVFVQWKKLGVQVRLSFLSTCITCNPPFFFFKLQAFGEAESIIYNICD